MASQLSTCQKERDSWREAQEPSTMRVSSGLIVNRIVGSFLLNRQIFAAHNWLKARRGSGCLSIQLRKIGGKRTVLSSSQKCVSLNKVRQILIGRIDRARATYFSLMSRNFLSFSCNCSVSSSSQFFPYQIFTQMHYCSRPSQ